jgi:hypothetical protein
MVFVQRLEMLTNKINFASCSSFGVGVGVDVDVDVFLFSGVSTLGSDATEFDVSRCNAMGFEYVARVFPSCAA